MKTLQAVRLKLVVAVAASGTPLMWELLSNVKASIPIPHEGPINVSVVNDEK
jgi:hypothetical protein